MASKRRVDIKKILADPDLRRKLMVSTIQATQARENIETSKEQADRAYYVVTEGERAAFFDLGKYRGGKGESDRRHEMFVRRIQGGVDRVRFDVALRDFSAIEGTPLTFGRIGLVAHVFKEFLKLEPAWGIARQGKATGDDSRWVRQWWEILTKTGWVPFAKGGDYCRFYSDIDLVLDWKPGHREVLKASGNALPSIEYYFKPGLTWPLRTQRGFNLRVMSSGCIFGHKGPAIFPNTPEDSFFLLGIGNSAFSEYTLQGLASFGSWEVGVVKRLPVPRPTSKQKERINELAQSIHDAKASWDSGNEISTRFDKPWLLREDIIDPSAPITQRLDRLVEYEASGGTRIQTLYDELNDEVYRLYGIPENTRKVIEETLGDRPPEVIWPQMEGKVREQKRMEHVWRLLSYMVKRVVEADEDGVVPFDTFFKETGLVDRVYREIEDLFSGQPVSRVEVDIVNELKKKVKGYRSVDSIREWLEDIFFSYHASLYKKRPVIWHISSSQGKGQVAFGALVHYHRFDRNGMALLRGTYLREAMEFFRREAALASRENREEDRLEWQAKLEEAQDLDRRLQLVQEGRHEGPEFEDRDFRILTPWKSTEERPKGWDPDMDDGVKVNIEPLQKAGILRIPKVI